MKPFLTKLFQEKFQSTTPISVVTCYDYSFARLVAQTPIDCILVGDSLGMVVQGNDSTLPVTLEEMVYHAKAVRKGAPEKCIIVDMPFMTYQVSVEKALENCGLVMKLSGADAVKIEGAEPMALETISRLTKLGIPVMGHLGLTPQSVNTLGGFRLQGKLETEQAELLQNAKLLQEAGAFSLVLEMIPESLGEKISGELQIPTIGIGAGKKTGGQVLVIYDLLGMNEQFHPKFLKKYADLSVVITTALGNYHDDTIQRK